MPKDAQHGSFYYAALTNGNRDISVDSFIVLVDGPVWDDTKQAPNNDQPVKLPNIGKKDPNSFPKNPVYEVFDKDGNKIAEGDLKDPNSPVGVTIDPTTGDLTFDPKKQSTEPGVFRPRV